MNIKKTKIALALSGLMFLAAPLPSAFAHDKHCEIKDTPLGDTMKYMKSELRGYVKGVKGDDPQKMQQHLNGLLKLIAVAAEQTPVKIKNMQAMDHGDMESKAMEHSDMKMDSAEHDMSKMPGMSNEQHHLHMQYMQDITELQELFKALNTVQNKAEIKDILGKIKQHIKKNHQQFRQDCN